MKNKPFILICLLTIYLSTYRPMTMKNFDFGADVCYYKDVSHNNGFEYVKPCESGKVCVSSLNDSPYEIRKCIDYQYFYRTINDECKNNEECPGNLICTSNKCDFDGNKPYGSYCPYGKVIETNECKEKTNGDKCEVNNADGTNSERYNPGYFKECGLIDLQLTSSGSNLYYEKTISSSFYCSVPDDSFVKEPITCEHGFALYFYGNKKYKSINNPENPTSGGLSPNHHMYLRCVTVTGVDKYKNVIKYKIGESGTEEYYLIDELPESTINYKDRMENLIDEFTMTKLEIFQNYKKRYDEIKDECSRSLYDDEPETCRDDELRKWYYFYGKPEEYILYKNEPMIMEYLIQTKYSNYKAQHTNSSGFLNLNILILLFALISF